MFRRPPKRAEPRPDQPVTVQIMGSGFLDVLAVRDISARGVGVHVSHCFEGCRLDDTVDLVITLPRERPFLARGRIAHRTKSGDEFFGVEFTEISRADSRRIRQYVKGLASSA